MHREPGAVRRRGRGRTVVAGAIAVAIFIGLVAVGSEGSGNRSAASDHALVAAAAAGAPGAARTTLVSEPAVPRATSPPATTPAATAALTPSTNGLAPVVSRIATTDKVIFLGIDDGLVRDPAVLDFLAANQIPFTAFLVTGPLQSDPAFWARARTVGGTIEAHTINHPDLTKVSADQARREICGSADAIAAATGVRPALFRPPYGAYNDTVRAIVAQCGFRAMVMWKGSTNDGRVDFQEGGPKPGDILLMHWRTDLLTNLQNVLAVTKAQGFRIARLEDYLEPLP
jgi:peptidoglycan/xylan/chitin deacetylase (PgdA/CDA1 family)